MGSYVEGDTPVVTIRVVSEWIPVENGQINGIWETYYPDSSPKSRRGFLQGVLHGIDEEFTNDGKPLRHSINEYGQRSGVSTHWEYWKNGRLQRKYSKLNGVLHGEYETFHESGQLTEKSKYRAGSEIGRSEYWEYWDYGKLRKRYSKVRGVIQGEVKVYDRHGEVEEYDVNGNRVVTKTPFDSEKTDRFLEPFLLVLLVFIIVAVVYIIVGGFIQ